MRSDDQFNALRVEKKKHKAIKGFMALGYGTVAYFDLIQTLIVMFLCLSLVSIPTLYLLSSYEGRNTSPAGFLHSLSFGNLGFSQTVCNDVSLGVSNLTLHCPVGEIREVVSFGVTPHEAKILDSCMPNEETVKCYEMYDDEQVKEYMERKCLGKVTCKLNLKKILTNSTTNPLCNSKFAQFFAQVKCTFNDRELESRQ